YRADGLRHAKTVNGTATTHVWNGSHIALERDASGATINLYHRTPGGQLINSPHHGTPTYNARGDVMQRSNASGQAQQNYHYSAFGMERSQDAANNNPYRFAGEYFDAERGEYYLRARSYNPRTGRFTQPDPHWNVGNMQGSPLAMMQAANLYAYTANNPVKFIDPTGNRVQMTIEGQQAMRASYAAQGLTPFGGFHSRDSFAPSNTSPTLDLTRDVLAAMPSNAAPNSVEAARAGEARIQAVTLAQEMYKSKGSRIYGGRDIAQIAVDATLSGVGMQGLAAFQEGRPQPEWQPGFIWFEGVPRRNVRTYSLGVHGDMLLHINGVATGFTIGQFSSSCGADNILIDDLLIYYLNRFDRHFSGDMNINSGFRTNAFEMTLDGGVYNGPHTSGEGADFRIYGASAQELYEFARYLGIARPYGHTYRINHRSIHIDTRRR
ncbi:MAG: D-Ala-D-Ala carboxypeptidase family metallohydrolase, partial [Defluviitaleaceae bacterium]|nr:D-Ala-D-Ala carboxypeptidase family metallohydrolase [Defluviitaleaceae bacterium]